MDSKLEKTFMPGSGAKGGSSATSLGSIIGGGIFLIVALMAGGVFLYGQYLDNINAQIEQEISKEADNIDKEVLNELKIFDARLNSVDELLSGHIASSKLLKLIGETTVKSISFDSLEFKLLGDTPTVSISGVAPDFRSVAAQVGILRVNENFQKVLMSELGMSEEGVGRKITFKIDVQVDPEVIGYHIGGTEYVSEEENMLKDLDIDSEVVVPDMEDENNVTN